jgi:5-methylcytosine-specific restriction enzyme A
MPGCPERLPCRVHPEETRMTRTTPKAVRAWYHLARWRHPVWGRRAQVLARDPFCVECRKVRRLEPTTDVDHIIPHEGDPVLFWDPENLQGLCASHHAQKTQREQPRARGRTIARSGRAQVGGEPGAVLGRGARSR